MIQSYEKHKHTHKKYLKTYKNKQNFSKNMNTSEHLYKKTNKISFTPIDTYKYFKNYNKIQEM